MANLSSYLPDGIDESSVAITGGTINGTTIGASTAAAGTFTTFTSNGIDDNADATAITIDSSENVSITPSGGVITLGANGHLTSKQSLDVATAGGRYIGSSNRGIVGQMRIEQTATGADGGYLTFDTCASGSTSPTERMRITSDGLVGIGTDSPSDRLHVKNGSAGSVPAHPYTQFNLEHSTHTAIQISTPNTSEAGIMWADPEDSDAAGILYYHASDYMYFRVNAAERMRITSDGNVAIGNTGTSSVRLRVYGTHSDSTNYAFEAANSSGNTLFNVRNDGLMHLGTSTNSPYNFTTSNSANAYLNSSGNIQRSTSSRRYKSDITDMTYGLSDVMNLRPVTFEGINDADGRRFGGFIAEEVHDAGLTEFVDYNTEDEPDALAYGNMVALLTKALQDQQAMIETLQAEVAALKGA